MLYLTLRQYEYVTAIARHGSLSAASEALNVSQPALSNALSRIEEHIGQPLFLRRRGAALIPTPRGRRFAQHAQSLLDQATSLETSESLSATPARLALGCFSDLAPFMMAPALRALRTALPETNVEYFSEPFQPLITALLTGRIDLALTYDLGLDESFEKHQIAQVVPHALVTPNHPLAQKGEITLQDIGSAPLILSLEGLSVQHMLSLFRSQGLRPYVAHRAGSLELLRSLAANGEGIGISYSLPPNSQSYDGKALVSLPISDTEAAEPIVLVSHGASSGPSTSEAVQALIEALKSG
ncbi:MAG: LysR family transcriptional regulator [Rhodobacteraceae bacterium]|nr:LysR family transcriptional regulator [Paracoccaceae bacterium]